MHVSLCDPPSDYWERMRPEHWYVTGWTRLSKKEKRFEMKQAEMRTEMDQLLEKLEETCKQLNQAKAKARNKMTNCNKLQDHTFNHAHKMSCCRGSVIQCWRKRVGLLILNWWNFGSSCCPSLLLPLSAAAPPPLPALPPVNQSKWHKTGTFITQEPHLLQGCLQVSY